MRWLLSAGVAAITASLAAGVADPDIDLTVGVYNASGAEVSELWHPQGAAGLTLRIGRVDGGAVTSAYCASVPGTFITKVGSDTKTEVTIGDATPSQLYVAYPLTIDETATTGIWTLSADESELVCGGRSSIAINAANFLRIGFAPTVELQYTDDESEISSPLSLSNEATGSVVPLNTGAMQIVVTFATLKDYDNDLDGLEAENVFVVPEGFPAITSTPVFDNDAHTLTYTVESPVNTAPGVYDITLLPGVLQDADGIRNAQQRIRTVFQMPQLLANGATGHQATQRSINDTHVVFVTNAATLNVAQVVGEATVESFSEVFSSLTRLGSSVNLLTGLTITSKSEESAVPMQNFTLPIAFLGEGTYTLTRNTSTSFLDLSDGAETLKRNVAFIVDRTAPVAKAATWSGTHQIIGEEGNVQLSSSLFTDTISTSASQITVTKVTAVNGDSAGFYPLVPAPLSDAYLLASTITGAPRDVVFKVTAEDEAGNTATALFTITVYAAPAPTIVVADARQKFTSGTLRTGGTKSLTSGVLVITAVATFADPITGITADDLVVGGATATDKSVTASSGNRVFTFKFTISDVTTDSEANVALLADAGTRTSDGASTQTGNAPHLLFDTTAPTLDNAFTDDAVVSLPFFAYIPATVFTEDKTGAANQLDGSTAAGITVLSGTSTEAAGLAIAAGTLGRAYVYGTPTSLPSNKACAGSTDRYVSFTLMLADEAGNTATTTLCVLVSSESISTTLSLSAANIAFTEGGSAKNLDSSAAFTSSTGTTANKIVVYLETPDAVSSNDEVLAGTAPSGTLDAYSQSATSLVGTLTLTAATDNGYSATNAATFLKSITYANSKTRLTKGNRIIRAVVLRKVDGTNRHQVIAVGSRKVVVSIINNAPVVAATVTGTYSEATDFEEGVAIISDITITDSDDTTLSAARVTITKTASEDNYGACDSTRDYLVLPSDYIGSPVVTGAWVAASCQLVITPRSGTGVALEDMAAALKSVRYKNKNDTDPAAMQTTAWKLARRIEVVVVDNAAGGATGATAVSSVVNGPLSLELVDDPPTINRAIWYGVGGQSYSSQAGANVKALVFSDEPTVTYTVRKHSIKFDKEGNGTVEYTFAFDLTKQSDGIFGKGAIVDTDTADPSTDPASHKIDIVDKDLQVVTPANVLAPGSLNDGNATFSTTDASTITLVVLQADDTATGEYALRLNYNSLDVYGYIWFDLRSAACANDASFSSATNFPIAAKCVVAPSNISAATGANLTFGQYQTIAAQLEEQLTSLTAGGLSLAEQIQQAAATRAAAHGTFNLQVPANSFSSASGNLFITAAPISSTVEELLPPVGKNEIADATSAVQLLPAGAQFPSGLTITIFVGDTPSGYTRSLRIASQVDNTDASQGYNALEPVADVEFNPVTGMIKGIVYHFSTVVPVLVPIVPTATIPKVVGMGGACPNDCSGHGFCRVEGKCTCYAGYTGVDCGERTCAADESWDTFNMLVHHPAECSNRGVCDRATGQCRCYEGFEGTACQRTTCPNGCSGRGRCRLLKDLPLVQQAGYSSWEVERLQVCRCDGGYTGLDCSERQCAFGDDPETVCADDNRQVQTLELDFGSMPPGSVLADVEGDQLALTFLHVDGSNYTTGRIEGVLDAAAGKENLEKALKSLPGFAVSDVTVNSAVDAAKVTYTITFDGASFAYSIGNGASTRITASGNTVPGRQNLLQCPTDSAGSMGCTAAGCRPLFQQMRLLSSPASDITISSTAILRQPSKLSDSDDITGEWGVEVTIVVATDGNGIQTYEATSMVYGKATGTVDAETVTQTPIPPQALRTKVPIVYGLEVDFESTVNDGSYVFKWKLPACIVTETTEPSAEFESLECSGRGICDRKAGECRCFAGYAGSNCGQQTVIV